MGSWRGPVGNRLFAQTLDPSTIIDIDIVSSQGEGLLDQAARWFLGGHMDYFDRNLQDKNGVNNLRKTIDAIWGGIKP
ncbi:hypothetical protein [Bacillus horti]|uniref:Uncharacterized protein n=1 Tax=Caldalkalibacillus horti TaxID=77523 RepID=A0ABT9W5I3_9BACI|nr:hypothetical protein [Bacillus horti]